MISRNKKIIMILSTVFTIVLALSLTYAFFYYSAEGGTITLESGSISINFTEEVNYFTIHNGYPKSDVAGMIDVNYYDFTVSGSRGGEDAVLYEIQIEQLEGNTLTENDIKVYLTNQNDDKLMNPILLSDAKISKYNSNRVVYTDYIYGINQVEEYRLRLWVDENYTENVENSFSFKVVLHAVNEKADLLYEKVEESLEEFLLNDDGDMRIVSGGSDEVTNNYVWYSGKLWRIVALNNDGSIKLVTDKSISATTFGSTTEFENSWIYQWLNEDFLDTLYNYEDLIVTNYKWNATTMTTVEKPEKTTMVEVPVGLLNLYEYASSYNKNSNYNYAYLRDKTLINWLLTPYNSSFLWAIKSSGGYEYENYDFDDLRGVRPSINLVKGILIDGGNGSINSPYTLIGDIKKPYFNELLNNRVSGEYVKISNQVYRIVNVENNNVKLTQTDVIRNASNGIIKKYLASNAPFGSSKNEQTDGYWDYYLKNIWYNNLDSFHKNIIVKSDWYLGAVRFSSYKNSICANSNTVETTKSCSKTQKKYYDYIGLGRIGEMFTVPLDDIDIWTITPNISYIYHVFFTGSPNSDAVYSKQYAVKPSFVVNSSVKIISGLGTEGSPFEISL